MKKILTVALSILCVCVFVTGCAGKNTNVPSSGYYTCEFTVKGGSAAIVSPAKIVSAQGKTLAFIVFENAGFEYMEIGSSKIFPGSDPTLSADSSTAVGAVSGFTFPAELDKDVSFKMFKGGVAEEYTIRFERSTLKQINENKVK